VGIVSQITELNLSEAADPSSTSKVLEIFSTAILGNRGDPINWYHSLKKLVQNYFDQRTNNQIVFWGVFIDR